MKKTEIIMGMPITINVPGLKTISQLDQVFDYFRHIDDKFSPYKQTSELTRFNNQQNINKLSKEMIEVLELCEQTKKITLGFFDIDNHGHIDTSGLVKGWAIDNAAKILKGMGYSNYFVEAGGDIQANGVNEEQMPWQIGIRNPFDINQIVKVIAVSNKGVATSGNYIRGDHIYDPITRKNIEGIASLTVIGPNIFEADRFATAGFAMGNKGIYFIDALPFFEAYLINDRGIATLTKGFEEYVV
jgi:thiamine biosynthesis lipoprotein